MVTSLGHLSKSREMMDSSTDLSGIETMSNDDSVMTDIQRDESNDVTRCKKQLCRSNVKPERCEVNGYAQISDYLCPGPLTRSQRCFSRRRVVWKRGLSGLMNTPPPYWN